jgi:hypothetical protein
MLVCGELAGCTAQLPTITKTFDAVGELHMG